MEDGGVDVGKASPNTSPAAGTEGIGCFHSTGMMQDAIFTPKL